MKTIRAKLMIFFISVVVGLILLGIVLNRFFLEDYYVYKNKDLFLNAREEIYTLYQQNEKKAKSFMEQIDRVDGLNTMIVDKNLKVQFVAPRTKSQQDSIRLPKEIEDFVSQCKVDTAKGYVYGVVKKQDKQLAKIIMVSPLGADKWLIMTKAMKGVQESAQIANQFYMIGGTIIILIGTIIIFVFSKRITRPIVEMSQVAQQMAQLDFKQHIEVQSQDEIGQLGMSINVLSEKLDESMRILYEDIDNKKMLIRNMSHELKTPIGVIKGYTEGLKYGVASDKEKMERYCDVIVEECDQMNSIVRQLLQLSQMNEGTFEVHKTYVLVERLVNEVMERFTPEFEKEGITCKSQVSDKLKLYADVQLMEQVLNNFMSNAIHHTEGEKRIEIIAYEGVNKVVLSVFNTGNPIPEKDLEQVWDVFYKVDKARTRRYGGHGIGLSIVKQITELHGGTVGVKNQEKGVLFFIELPLFHKDFVERL